MYEYLDSWYPYCHHKLEIQGLGKGWIKWKCTNPNCQFEHEANVML